MSNLRYSTAIILVSLAVSLLPDYAAAKSPATQSSSSGYRFAQNNGRLDRQFMDQQRNARQTDDRAGQSVERISRDQAAAIARDATGGRVLKVRLQGDRYYVRMLLDGERVRTVRVDARTGQIR